MHYSCPMKSVRGAGKKKKKRQNAKRGRWTGDPIVHQVQLGIGVKFQL